ncbi:DUF5391 family protein [Peribacillus sp. NPDC097675]|uniref:DUF5391 family protein n=1 Tax=Peribacillus sp. NPDC097675 TaxID=3390618 RepID=UPI003D092EFD
MKNKNKIIGMTLFSALLFCMVIVMCSLSPLSETSVNANQFNSIGMWLSIALVFALYIVPVLLYGFGLKWMKYLMAIFCSLGLVVLLPMIGIVLVIGAMDGFTLSLIGVIIVSGMNVLVNTLWFFTTFSKGSKKPLNRSMEDTIQY